MGQGGRYKFAFEVPRYLPCDPAGLTLTPISAAQLEQSASVQPRRAQYAAHVSVTTTSEAGYR